MNYRRSDGFALPSVLIASIVMLTVLLVAVQSTAAVRVSLVSQYYNQLSRAAGDAGIAYAKTCLDANNDAPQWSNANPLMPNTDCAGVQLTGFTCPINSNDTRCSVMVNNDVRISFSVSVPNVDINGKATSLSSIGTVNLFRTSDNVVWRTYSQAEYAKTTVTDIVTNGLVLDLDAGDQASYPGAGTTWTDLSGNGNAGTLTNGVGYDNGDSGALSFDGVNDYVSFVNNTLELGTGNFTIDLFAYIGDSAYTWQRLFGKKGIGGAEQGYSIYWGGANQKLMWSTANGAAGHEYWTNDTITINTWHHIVMVRNSSDARIGYYYVDGQREDITTIPAIDDVTKSTAVPYAGSLGGTSLQFEGSISGIRVYNRALNANEIQQNFNALKTRYSNVTLTSCSAILNAGKSTGSGVYWINPTGTPFQAYCDMTTDGGGWTLVLQNNSTVSTPSPTWANAINSNNVSGTLGSDQTAFDVLVGLSYWNSIGSQLRLQTGSSPSTISHKATYIYSLDVNNFYAINLSNQNILLGGIAPGLYTSHNNNKFTTYDADNDTYGSNCSALYGNHPWWYNACWSGNFFAGGSGYQEAAYWTGAGADYYAHGSIWVK